MQRTLILVGLVGLVGCVPESTGSGPTSARASAPPSAPASSAGPPPTAPAVPEAGVALAVPDGKPKWKSVPAEREGFYAVLDGLCSKLGVGRVGKDVVVHYGGRGMFANERDGNASFIALRETGLESIGDPAIASPTGIAGQSIEDFWIADSTGTRTSFGAILHRRANGQWKTYAKDQTNLHAWLDGGIIGQVGFAVSNGELWVEGSSTKPPPQLTDGFGLMTTLAAFPTGEVILTGRSDPSGVGPFVVRHWSPGQSIKQHSLAFLGQTGWPVFVESATDEVYVVMDSKAARWDGSKWKLLGTAKGPIAEAKRAAPDDLWVLLESGAVQRSTPQGFVPVVMPEPIAALDGIDKGAPWAIGRSGKAYKRDGETWKTVTLPPPTFSAGAALKAKSVLVNAPDDVLIIAQYWEKGIGWKEQELHTTLLRTKAPKETLRCNEPDPENNNVHIGRGFQSWPPIASSACTTPFAVLARKSNALKSPPSDWPKIRAGLKGHAELGEVSLVEFVSGDRTFVGAKGKDYESAKKMAELAAGKDRLRPEIVCGEPDAVRTLPIDLATGTVAAR